MNAELILKKDIRYEEHPCFYRIIAFENDGFNITVRHIKPVSDNDNATFEIVGKAKDYGYIDFEYQSCLEHINGKDFIYKLGAIATDVRESDLQKYLDNQIRMMQYTGDTIENLVTYLENTELAKYIV